MMETTSGVAAEMPRYKCHKQVWALKIDAVNLDADVAKSEGRETTGGATIYPEDKKFAPFTVDIEYVRKHKPESGGYYVVYDDGYKSYSPAKPFEDGYTELSKVTEDLSAVVDRLKAVAPHVNLPKFRVVTPGHRYELDQFESYGLPGCPVQMLQFIEKRPKEGGAPGELETVNDGTTNEAVLEVLIDRLNSMGAKFPCRENSIAITKLEEALMWLNRRTANRKARGVEGKALA